jgi:hypothetical protein
VSLEWNSQFLIHTSTFLAVISAASQLLLCLFGISLRLGIGVYNTLASKNLCKIAQAFKSSDSNAQHFLLDLLTHSWFHSMLFALPGYQFPYTVMNRCFYLICAQAHHAQSSLLGNSCGAPTHASKGRLTPRGRANSLCKRLVILTCDWSKGSNRSQPLYTYMPGRFGGMNYFIKNVINDTARACWIGCTQNGGPILGLEANVTFH